MAKNEKAKKPVSVKKAPAPKVAATKALLKAAPKTVSKTVSKQSEKKSSKVEISRSVVAKPKKVVAVKADKAPLKESVKLTEKSPSKSAAKLVTKKSTEVSKVTKSLVKSKNSRTKVASEVMPVKQDPKKVVSGAVTKKAAAAKTVQQNPAAKNVIKSPIIVKPPLNQNILGTARSAPNVNLPTQKASAAASSLMVRPAYRPIQVINKPLTPIQPHRAMAPIQKPAEKAEFKKGDYVCYPAHGVGEIEAVETQIIGGMEIKLYAIAFEKDRMRLKVPVARAHASGLRRLSSAGRIEDALKTLQGRAQVRRAMWSRRAQEYETKINSGDPVSIAEVLRDLKRSNDDNDQSYSERQIYQSALERLAREVAAVEKITESEASDRLESMIRGRKARAAAEDQVADEASNEEVAA